MTNITKKVFFSFLASIMIAVSFPSMEVAQAQTTATPPVLVKEWNLGAGTFPDVTYYQGRIWIAVQQDSKLNLYNFASDLTDQKVMSIPFGGGQAFPRLTVHNNILWLAFRDGNNSEGARESIKLWRSDTKNIETIAGGFGNHPIALGHGYIAWQTHTTLKVQRRALVGGAVTIVRDAESPGLSRILPGGTVVTIVEDLNIVPWGVAAWFAGPLVVTTDVTPHDDNGLVMRLNNDPATEFNIWENQIAHTPHAATDGNGNYVVVAWNPSVRIALINDPQKITATDNLPQIKNDCDPAFTDPLKISECSLGTIESPETIGYGPAEDPEHPLSLPLSGVGGFDGAYGETSGQVLLVSGNILNVARDERGIVGTFIDVETMVVEGESITIATPTAGAPRIVYSRPFDKFLVAWVDWRGGERSSQVYGRFVSINGEMPSPEFQIIPNKAVLTDIKFDSRNNKFVVLADGEGQSIIKTIDENGTVSQDITVPRQISAEYEGQSSLAVNTNQNQYWVQITGCDAQNEPTSEDCRHGLYRYDITAGTWIGNPIILTKPNIGYAHFGRGQVVYSPVDRVGLVVWCELSPANRAGQWSRTVDDYGNVGNEFPVINAHEIFPFSSGYGCPHLNYNPWTNTVFDSTEDNQGGSILIEMAPNGLVLNIRQSIAPPRINLDDSFGIQKIANWLVQKAQAAEPFGTFYPGNIMTPNGALSVGTQGYARIVVTSTRSTYASISPAPTATADYDRTTNVDVSTLPRLINQIYKWSLGIGALFALLMVVIGGYRYMTSAGNAESAGKGTEMIWGAIIGLCLLFGAYLVLNTINPDLVRFKIDLSGLTSSLNLGGGTTPETPGGGTVIKPIVPTTVLPKTKQEVIDLIEKYAAEFGVDPLIPKWIAGCESNFTWNAQNPAPNSSASGVFQFINSTWAATPEGQAGTSVFDAEANVRAAVRIIKERGTSDWNASKACWGPKI